MIVVATIDSFAIVVDRHLRVVTITSFSVEAAYFLEPEVTCVQLKVVM